MNDWRALPYAPAAGTRLCAATEVPDGQGKEIVYGEGKEAFRVVVLRLGERLFAFHNCFYSPAGNCFEAFCCWNLNR